jgi:hypothetical protein
MNWLRALRIAPMVTATVALSGLPQFSNAAPTQFEINPDTPPAPTQTLTAGPIKVVVNQKKTDNDRLSNYTLNYQLFHSDVPKLSASATTWISGGVELKDLDRNAVSEVIVSTFSGGAHCCMSYTIYGWQQNKFVAAKLGPLDGGGGQFKDLDGNGTLEFVTADNAFFYAFAPYAGSFPPTRIYQYKAGRFVNATRQYPKTLKAHAWDMFTALQQHQNEDISLNGILAGYVAQKILLGEYQQGWNLMMARYDRKSDWGLAIYRGDKEIGKYPNFPTALKAFLMNQGYLDQRGNPISIDR